MAGKRAVLLLHADLLLDVDKTRRVSPAVIAAGDSYNLWRPMRCSRAYGLAHGRGTTMHHSLLRHWPHRPGRDGANGTRATTAPPRRAVRPAESYERDAPFAPYEGGMTLNSLDVGKSKAEAAGLGGGHAPLNAA